MNLYLWAVVRFSVDNLRTGVERTAAVGAETCGVAEVVGQPEVCNLHVAQVVQDDVLQLQVTVNYAVLVTSTQVIYSHVTDVL